VDTPELNRASPELDETVEPVVIITLPLTVNEVPLLRSIEPEPEVAVGILAVRIMTEPELA